MTTAAQLFEITAADVASTNDEWYTPRWIFDAAGLTFDLDVCAPVTPEFRTCPARRYLTILEDGLATPWEGLVWMNPPYSRPGPWVERFVRHPHGLALVPPASSPWRRPLVKFADGLALITVDGNEARRGRGFGRPDGRNVSYPTALLLVARGQLAVSALEGVARADTYADGAYHVRPTE
jgi:hypothetical protein